MTFGYANKRAICNARRLRSVGLSVALLAMTLLCAHAAQTEVVKAGDAPIVTPTAPGTGQTRLARIKDVSSIEGIRDNQLVGYGIVVGLNGTGDSQQTVFPYQTLASTLLRMGVSISSGSIMLRNMAAVFVEATLPPFSEPGTKLDITVSSAGDARSLEGGMLLMTPLYGADGQIYAQAQGPLVVGGYSVSQNGNTREMNHPTTARIPLGAMVERGVPVSLAGRSGFTLLLNDADFKSAEAMAGAINQTLGRNAAEALDSRRVELKLRTGEDAPALLAKVEEIHVATYPKAKVVVNERTGTVVIGGDVVLQPVSILHGGLSVNIVSQFQVSQPNAFAQGTTKVVQQTNIRAQDKPVSSIELRQGATVDDLVASLQKIGASARDVISILQAMKAAGALEAELEVL
ncbi:MAG: flagellar basal body P-ring protein FlgI [Acidobacteriaceae bacterium]